MGEQALDAHTARLIIAEPAAIPLQKVTADHAPDAVANDVAENRGNNDNKASGEKVHPALSNQGPRNRAGNAVGNGRANRAR